MRTQWKNEISIVEKLKNQDMQSTKPKGVVSRTSRDIVST